MPIILLLLSHIIAPIFSIDASSMTQSAIFPFPFFCSISSILFLTVRRIPFKNVNKVDFPAPVGITITIQTNIGSNQSVPKGLTTAWDVKYEIKIKSPDKTEVAGTLNAFPIWAQPCQERRSTKENQRNYQIPCRNTEKSL